MNHHRRKTDIKGNSRVRMWFIWASLFILTALLGLIAFWSYYPYKVRIDTVSPYKVITPVVETGGSLQYQRHTTKVMDIQGIASCKIIDGIEYQLPTRITTGKPRVDRSIQLVVIPDQIMPGNYRYICQVSYRVNPIRTIEYKTTTEVFKVVPATDTVKDE